MSALEGLPSRSAPLACSSALERSLSSTSGRGPGVAETTAAVTTPASNSTVVIVPAFLRILEAVFSFPVSIAICSGAPLIDAGPFSPTLRETLAEWC